jgi:dihydrofolate synthase/folylpolyglutamate synthase
MSVGMAFDYFAKKSVDIAIIEVGMGGRLDATNIITPLVSVITNGLDHTQFLGNTIEAIAGEKAGITKLNVPCGEYTQNKAVLQLKPQKKSSASILLQMISSENYPSDLKGITKFIIRRLFTNY